MADRIKIRHVYDLVTHFGEGYRDKKLNLEGADLRCAKLNNVRLREANLKFANLKGASLGGTNLSRTNLFCAELTGANLRYADLICANLYSARLRRADLSHACLAGADLRRTDLSGACFYSVNLSDIKFDWESPELIFELLRRAADTPDKHALACFLCDLGIDRFKKQGSFGSLEYLKPWAVSVLKGYEGWERYLRG